MRHPYKIKTRKFTRFHVGVYAAVGVVCLAHGNVICRKCQHR